MEPIPVDTSAPYVQWLVPAATAIAGWAAVKFWERARPLCFSESFSTGLSSEAKLEFGPDLSELTRESCTLRALKSGNNGVQQAMDSFRGAITTIRLIQESRPDLQRLLQSAHSCSSSADRKRWIADLLHLSVVPHILVLGLMREEISMDPAVVDRDPNYQADLVQSQDGDQTILCLRHGRGLIPIVVQSPEFPTNFELAKRFTDACRFGDAKALATFVANGMAFLDKQLELHRKIGKELQRQLIANTIVSGYFCIANRGSALLLVAPEAVIEFKTAHGAAIAVPGQVATIAGNSPDGFQPVKGTAVIKGGDTLRGVIVSKQPIASQSGAEQIIAAAKKQDAQVRIRIVRQGSVFPTFCSKWVSFHLADDVTSIELP